MEELLTIQEVADLYRTSPETVRYWRHIGYGPKGRKVGRKVLYEVAEVQAFWDSLQAVPGTAVTSDPVASTAAHAAHDAERELQRARPLKRRPQGPRRAPRQSDLERNQGEPT